MYHQAGTKEGNLQNSEWSENRSTGWKARTKAGLHSERVLGTLSFHFDGFTGHGTRGMTKGLSCINLGSQSEYPRTLCVKRMRNKPPYRKEQQGIRPVSFWMVGKIINIPSEFTTTSQCSAGFAVQIHVLCDQKKTPKNKNQKFKQKT